MKHKAAKDDRYGIIIESDSEGASQKPIKPRSVTILVVGRTKIPKDGRLWSGRERMSASEDL